MGLTTTISSYDEPGWRHRLEIPDDYNIAAGAFASSYITGLLWALNGSQEM